MPLSTLIRGDDWKFTFTITDKSTGLAQDVTGGAVWLTFKTKILLSGPDTSASFQVKNLDIQAGDDPENDVVNGIVVLRARWDSAATSPTDSTEGIDLPAGSYIYDMQYQDVTTNEITTTETGSVSIAAQTTKSNVG
jgi:hypothetical protein